MNILQDLNKYLEDLSKLFKDFKTNYANAGFKENYNSLIEVLANSNFYISELMILKNYFSCFDNLSTQEIVRNKKYLAQIDEHLSYLRILNSSGTTMLRAITLGEKYKSECSNLKVQQENKFGILYYDEIQDYYLLFHKRSGNLERFCKPYLTRTENRKLAEKLFTKLKNLERTQ